MKSGIIFWIIVSGIALGISGCGNKREIDAAFRSAEWLESSGRYKDAVSRYGEVLTLAPRSRVSSIAQLRIGDVYYRKLRDYESAKSVYMEIVDIHPDSVYASDARRKLEEIGKIERARTKAMKRGDSMFDQGRFGEALARYREAQQLDPVNRSIVEKIEDAQMCYDDKRKTGASSFMGKGDVSFTQRKYEEAIKEYLSAGELMPENEEIWEKIDMANAALVPVRREQAFEEALESGRELDLGDPETSLSLFKKLSPKSSGEGAGEAAQDSGPSETYWANFKLDLPDYHYYFQGYKLKWRPGDAWSTTRFSPAEFYFPFLKVPMTEFEKFESLCSSGTASGTRGQLRGVALFKIMGQGYKGGISAEVIDARLEIPGKGYFYILREETPY